MKWSDIDPWGDVRDRHDPRDWSKWAVWADWEGQYDWQDGADFEAFDIIAWRDEIFVNRNRRRPDLKPHWEKTGERMIIAEVRDGSAQCADWVYLVVIHSEGDEPVPRDLKIKRRARNILRHGARRWPRDGRSARAGTLSCSRDPPKNAPKNSSPIRSRFLNPGAEQLPPSRPPRPG